MASVPFPLVGIGASAGGLEALERLLPGLPQAPGFAVVIILHLAPDQPSHFAEALRRFCHMPVSQVTRHPTEIEANHVYVIAPGTLLKVEDRYLFLDQANASRTTLGAIDYFFHSLALSHRHLAVGVLLSGMGHDGCGGLAALREQGGTAIVQLPQDAQFAPLPQAAIDASQADMVLPAGEIAQRLLVLCAATAETLPEEEIAKDEAQALHEVLTMLHERTGHVFRQYKRPTILRRLERRLHLHGVRSVAEYRGLMARDGEEASRLMKDLLIGVTGFFRDRNAFERLREVVRNAMLEARGKDEMRAWVAACSTGQEAYSLAMLMADVALGIPGAPPVHIFASDIDEQALGVARAGLYPESIQDEVPAASLQRYFVRSGKQFRVRQSLREMITFASHNLLRDPPFSGLDLVTCRNLLIYLDRPMQKQVLKRFHFGLSRGGILFLGNAETADTMPELFAQVDRANRIYQARVTRDSAPSLGAAAPAQGQEPPLQVFHHVGPGPRQPMPASMDEMRERLLAVESGCEELQSNNEELVTINAELKSRLEDTDKANDDLNNLIASVDLATVFVDEKLVIQRFTPRAASIFNLIARDVGRSLMDITHRLDYPELQDDVAHTFSSLQPLEREVQGVDGRHYIVRVRPYRTGDDVIAGAVLTFFDVSQRHDAESVARELASGQEFLLYLGDCLRPLEEPMQLLALGCRLLGERLALPQLAFAEIRDGRFAVLPGHAAGAPPLQGAGEVASLGTAVLAHWRAGEVVVVQDLAHGGVGGAETAGGLASLAGGAGALLSAVCHKGQQWLGFFLACQPAARQWTRPEVALFAEAAARIGVEFERTRAQVALLASETRLRVLLRGFAQACWETDASGEAGEEGGHWLDAIHPEDRARAEGMWREAVQSGIAMEAEVRLQGANGSWRRASVLATPLLDEMGLVRQWSGCILDTDEHADAPSGSI